MTRHDHQQWHYGNHCLFVQLAFSFTDSCLSKHAILELLLKVKTQIFWILHVDENCLQKLKPNQTFWNNEDDLFDKLIPSLFSSSRLNPILVWREWHQVPPIPIAFPNSLKSLLKYVSKTIFVKYDWSNYKPYGCGLKSLKG